MFLRLWADYVVTLISIFFASSWITRKRLIECSVTLCIKCWTENLSDGELKLEQELYFNQSAAIRVEPFVWWGSHWNWCQGRRYRPTWFLSPVHWIDRKGLWFLMTADRSKLMATQIWFLRKLPKIVDLWSLKWLNSLLSWERRWIMKKKD